MAENTNQQKFDTPRSSPRAAAAIDVEVEVAGARKRVQLVSRDIGAGGMFLRTKDPAPLWKRVCLSFALPAGEKFEVSGEVVRSVSPADSEKSGHPPGMAIAFDEVSRSKRKELVALVLDLCAKRPEKDAKKPVGIQEEESRHQAPEPDAPVEQEKETVSEKDTTDDLLSELDDLLDSVESEIERETEAEESPDDDLVDFPSPDIEEESLTSDEQDDGSEASLRANLADYRKSLKGDTYYDLLGVAYSADPGEVEASYQQLLENLKPPAPPDSLPPDLLQELSSVLGKIRKAFAILSKPDRKRAYDFLIDNQVDDL